MVCAVPLDEERPFVQLGESGGYGGLEGEEGGVGGVVGGELECERRGRDEGYCGGGGRGGDGGRVEGRGHGEDFSARGRENE